MPIFEYQCDENKGGCGHIIEVMQAYSDKKPKKCPECNKLKLKRIMGVPSVRFSGSGWTPKFYSNE